MRDETPTRVPWWTTFGILVRKDLRVEWRARETLAPLVTVGLLVALVLNVGFDALPAPATILVASAAWVAIVFAAQVGLARCFVLEAEHGTLGGWQVAGVDLRAVFFAKALVNLLTITVAGLVTVAATAFFFDLDASQARPLAIGALLLGIVGITLVTTLAAAMSMHGRHWVLLVPLLGLPALFPLVATGVPLTAALLGGDPVPILDPAVRVLIAYDVVLLATAWALAPPLLEP